MRNKKFSGICACCGNERQLIQGHLIPKFIAQPIKGEIMGMFSAKLERPKCLQNGVYDHAWCRDCEDVFTLIDTDFSKIYHSFKNWKTIFYPNSDYEFAYEKENEGEILITKKFLLSILYRFSLSNNYNIDLNIDQKIIKEYLFEEKFELQDENCFFILLFAVDIPFLAPPKKAKSKESGDYVIRFNIDLNNLAAKVYMSEKLPLHIKNQIDKNFYFQQESNKIRIVKKSKEAQEKSKLYKDILRLTQTKKAPFLEKASKNQE